MPYHCVPIPGMSSRGTRLYHTSYRMTNNGDSRISFLIARTVESRFGRENPQRRRYLHSSTVAVEPLMSELSLPSPKIVNIMTGKVSSTNNTEQPITTRKRLSLHRKHLRQKPVPLRLNPKIYSVELLSNLKQTVAAHEKYRNCIATYH